MNTPVSCPCSIVLSFHFYMYIPWFFFFYFIKKLDPVSSNLLRDPSSDYYHICSSSWGLMGSHSVNNHCLSPKINEKHRCPVSSTSVHLLFWVSLSVHGLHLVVSSAPTLWSRARQQEVHILGAAGAGSSGDSSERLFVR